MLGLVLRAMAARRGQALAVLILCALAIGSAVASPWYVLTASKLATDNDVRAGSPAQHVVSVMFATVRSGDARSTLTGFDRTVERAYGSGLGTPVEGMTAFVRVAGTLEPLDLAYRDDVCAHVVLTGACPTTSGQIMITDQVARDLKLSIGGTIETKSDAGSMRLIVTGLYERADSGGSYWASLLFSGTGANSAASATTSGSEASPGDAVFTGINTMSDKSIPSVTLSDDVQVSTPVLASGGGLASRVSAGSYQLQQANMSVFSLAGGLADTVAADRRLVRIGVTVSLVELLGLCWFALFLAARYTALDRRADVGLLKLRGAGRFTLWRLSVGQSVVPMLGGLVLGVAVAWVAGLWLSQLAVRSRQAWEFSGAATVAALVGAFVAIGFAEWRTGRAGVNDLLRRVPARRRGLTADVVDLIVVVLAGAAAYQGWVDSSSTGLVTVAPSLVALAIALLCTRLLLAMCRRIGAAAMRTGRIRTAIGTLQVTRRPGIDRVFVLLALSVALLATAAMGWQAGSVARADRAPIELGASRVLTVQASSPLQLLSAVRAADPTGREAMAVEDYPDGQPRGLGSDGTVDGPVLAVDSSRFAAVAAWSKAYGSATAVQVASHLRAASPPPIEFTGTSLTIDADSISGREPLFHQPGPYLHLRLVNEATGRWQDAGFGPFLGGHQVLSTTVTGCAVDQCRLASMEITGPPTALDAWDVDPASGASAYQGIPGTQIVVHAINTPSGSVVSAAMLGDVGRWRTIVGASGMGLELGYSDGALRMAVSKTPLGYRQVGNGTLFVADAPIPIPAVQAGTSPDLTVAPGRTEQINGVPMPVRITDALPILPAIGGSGLLVDFETLQRTVPDEGGDSVFEVWLAPHAPAALITRLHADGLTIVGDDSIAAERARLSRQGPAAALRFQIVTGVVGLLLAAAALLVAAAGDRRSRAGELTAVRVQGLSRRSATAISYGGYAVLVGCALAAGLVAAACARAFAAVRVPAFVDDWSLVPVGRGLSLAPMLVVAAVALLIYGIAGMVAGRSVARHTS
jgi:putative ABC transport system permease protein